MIGWRDGDGRLHRGSLFTAFAALARGEAWSFPALRPHQREPWHAFTVQVAALALIRAGRDELPGDEAAWHDLLIGLTPDQPGGEAWALVVDDWSKPALLQPPVTDAAFRKEKEDPVRTADRLDMLVISRNHEIKRERMANSSEEDWLFALVTLQTTEGRMGAGRFGISRMNSGYGTRMSLGVRPSHGGAASSFRRDVHILLVDARNRLTRRGGTRLLWIDPWDGKSAMDFTRLDELYVEICRRVRLRRGPSGIEALTAGSEGRRISAKQLGGNTGDPWTPLTIDTNKTRETSGKLISVTPTGEGFSYRQVSRLFDAQVVTAPLLARLHNDDDRDGLAIVASALVRGKGKTEGLHRRAVRTSRVEEIEQFGDIEVLDRVGDVAKTRSDEAAAAADKLKYALLILLQGAPTEASENKKLEVRLNDRPSGDRAEVWISCFDQLVDRLFFDEAFWAEAAADDVNHRSLWRERLGALAAAVLAEAAEAAPRTEMRRIRAIARSRTMLDATMAKWLKEVAL